MVFWVEGMPDFESEQGIELINNIMSCTIPNDDEELKELVTTLQIHRHTPTCYKNNFTRCRFNFPRTVGEFTRIIDHTSDEFIRNGGRICELKRGVHEIYVNNYSPVLLKLWKANMDIQLCGSNEAIAQYIAKYISKNEPTDIERNLREAINHIQTEDNNISRKMFTICMRLLNHRQVSACECAFRLCHLPLRKSSRRCIFLNTRKPEKRYKVLNFGNDDTALGFCSDIIDRYCKRPTNHPYYTHIDDMSLIEFSMLFEPHYKHNKNIANEELGDDNWDETLIESTTNYLILTDGFKMKIRSKAAVIRVPYININTDTDDYYYSLLAQYFPFRNESELIDGFDNSKDSFLAKEELIREKCIYMDQFRQRDHSIEYAFNQAHAFQELEIPQIDVECDEINISIADTIHMSSEEFTSALASMNVGQRELFNYITRNIRMQLNCDNSRVKLFITGGAGSGKTFTLKLLREQIMRCYGSDKISVKVCALTGVAAKLINGSTLHSTLKLPVQKDGKLTDISMLTGNYLRRLRMQWKDVQFLIIDEVSMIPYEVLVMIDSRLKQLKDCENIFGGINVILMGDLLQLPPVRGHLIFHQPERMAPATNLWRQFSFCELTQNMRQRGDQSFISLLNNLREGKTTRSDLQILLEKLDDSDANDFALGKALRIHPTNAQVEAHNNKVLTYYKSKNVQMFDIQAQDTLVETTKNTKNNFDISKVTPSDINKTGGLPKLLTIFVSAKVMIRYNISTSIGLVNGAIGEIKEIIWPLYRRNQIYLEDIPSIIIDVDGTQHRLDPITLRFPALFGFGMIERRMLPIVLCWSSTVHKMQGSTVDTAVINLGSKIFAPGQAYVALSRVRSLNGLRLEELDCEKLTNPSMCNQAALQEMNRLRSLPNYLHQD